MRNAEEKLQIMATSHQIELQKIQEENDKNLVQVYIIRYLQWLCHFSETRSSD